MPAIMTSQGATAASKPSGLASVLGFLGPALATAGMAFGQAKDANAQNQKMKDWVSQNSVPMTNAQMMQDQQAMAAPQAPTMQQMNVPDLGNAFSGAAGGGLIQSSQPFQAFNTNMQAPTIGGMLQQQNFTPWRPSWATQ